MYRKSSTKDKKIRTVIAFFYFIGIYSQFALRESGKKGGLVVEKLEKKVEKPTKLCSHQLT